MKEIEIKSVYSSLTLHNICDNIAGWQTRQQFDGLGKSKELYWLDKLEAFLLNI